MRLDPARRRLIALTVGIAAVAVALFVLLGGGESDLDQARGASEEFASAIESGDFETACGLLTPELRESAGGEECPDQLAATVGTAAEEVDVEILSVRVSGPKAVADTRVNRSDGESSESSLELQLSDERWQISAFGS